LTIVAFGGCSSSGSTTAGSTTEDPAPKSADLRQVDWENASVPAEVCGGDGDLQLHDGVALVSSTRWTDDWQGLEPAEVPGQVEVWSYGDASFGDIDGDGLEDAAVSLWCTNGGGTAGGQLGQGLALMSGASGGTRTLGIAATDPANDSSDAHAPYFDISTVRIEDHRLFAEELAYRPHDGDCCPSGRTSSSWTLRHGDLQRDPDGIATTTTSHN
jgi:hypothetical protein